MKTVQRYDRGQLKSAVRTDEGYYLVEGYIARPGVYEYRQADGGVRRELIPEEELHRADSLATLARKPVTLEHPTVDGVPVLVDPENVKDFEVGDVDGSIEVEELNGFVKVKLAVRRKDGIGAIDRGIRELSPGYTVDLDETPGEHPKHGRYDAVQRNRRYNHAAITRAARGGAEIHLRGDAAEQVSGFDEPPTLKREIDIMTDVKKTVQDELQRRDAEDKAKRLEAENAELQKKLDEMEGKLDAMKKDAENTKKDTDEDKSDEDKVDEKTKHDSRMAWFHDRLDALGVASAMGVPIERNADISEIKRAVVAAHLGSLRQDASDDYLAGVYDHIVAQVVDTRQQTAYDSISQTLTANRVPQPVQPLQNHSVKLDAADADRAFRENLRKLGQKN